MRFFMALLCTLFLNSALAAEIKEYKISIREHRFVPAEITIPANTKIKLIVINEDASPEEFESHELNREKIVTGNGKITVFIGPLKPGRYPFFGEFHMNTAQGAIIVK
jgi:Cupredoxin-like domain